MSQTTPTDREFQVLPRGYVRDKVVLANFREGLRAATNPETGEAFTEEEIRRATQPKSRWYVEAQAIDDLAQAEQRRALYLADQIRPERASSAWLRDYHGRLWGLDPLEATAGSGTVQQRATAGTVIVGSTTLGDGAAHVARDAAGNTYQVLTSVVVDGTGIAEVELKALSTGSGTNPEAGTLLTWTRRDPNMEARCTVITGFSGGTDAETDGEFVSRLLGLIRYREGAGNDAQIRGWARQASNAIEDAFVYPCAFYAGSVMVAITQKRATASGPLARVPSADVLTQAIAYLTPPGSAVFPTPPHVLVVAVRSESVDAQMRIEMAAGSSTGWADSRPFPSYHATAPTITTVNSQTDIRITALGDATLPGQSALATLTGDDAPALMVWNATSSRFVELAVSSVEDLGSNVYAVLLSAAPTEITLATGQRVSPYTGRHETIAETAEAYFDGLGPSELFDVAADPRGSRCIRFPATSESYPCRAGAALATRVVDALGGSSSDATLPELTATLPTYPADLTSGPAMLTLGKFAVYPL